MINKNKRKIGIGIGIGFVFLIFVHTLGGAEPLKGAKKFEKKSRWQCQCLGASIF